MNKKKVPGWTIAHQGRPPAVMGEGLAGPRTWPEASRPSLGNGEPWMFLSKGIPVFL